MALHTGEAFERGDDYYGPTVNRAARIRSLATGGQVLVSQSTGELVRDEMPEHVVLVELGSQVLADLARAERIVSALAAPGLPELETLGTATARRLPPACRSRCPGSFEMPQVSSLWVADQSSRPSCARGRT